MTNQNILENLKLEATQLNFLRDYQRYGFRDESQMIAAALSKLQSELEFIDLQNSADLYAEIYQEDEDLQKLTEAALQEWPEA